MVRVRMGEPRDIEVTVAGAEWYVLAYLDVSHNDAELLRWLLMSHVKK